MHQFLFQGIQNSQDMLCTRIFVVVKLLSGRSSRNTERSESSINSMFRLSKYVASDKNSAVNLDFGIMKVIKWKDAKVIIWFVSPF